MSKFGSSILRHIVAVMASGMLATAAMAQSFPSRTITIVAPFPPGGGVDTLARPLVEPFRERLKQSVIIENRAGAGSNVGSAAVAKAQPDGHTLLINTDILPILPMIYPRLIYDPINELVPVGYVASAPLVIAVNPQLGINTIDDLLAAVRRDQSKINFANPGIGTPQHLAFELFSRTVGIKIEQVSYRGGGPALNDVIAGHVQVGVFTLGAVLPQIEGRNIRALAILGDRRIPALPDVPTIVEAGFQGAQSALRFIMFAPRGTPQPVLKQLREALSGALDSPGMTDVLARNAFEKLTGSTADIEAHLRNEVARWTPIIKELGLRLE
ncbi:MAG: Bug family tripartite tricarboxylate transporter substrate binding protein [Bosea sp. (in: a-proteobacteria)]